MLPEVYITGLGAISGIGNSVAENIDALKHGRCGIAEATHLVTRHRQSFPVGEVKADNVLLANWCNWSGTNSRSAMLAYLAAREAIVDAGFKDTRPYRTGFISATSVGGMDLTEDFYEGFSQNKANGKLRQVAQHECGTVTDRVAKALKIHDYVSTISTACSSSANAIMLGARLLQQGLLDVVVAGGTDALSRFTLNGFNTLMILDQQLCQPFDQQRRGLNLGEGAGFIVLVNEKVANAGSQKIYARLTGYCNANDAYHQTASSPDGIGSFMAMSGAMKMAALSPADVSYINLHGTGTQNNDASESTAIQRIFGEDYPKMSSTKSFTGHTLAACGGLEAVYSVVSINEQCIFPSLRIQQPVIAKPGAVVTEFIEHADVKNVLSNSFGFGGNCSSLVFSAV
jgi:3-oxoacyl-(acyl-carrier-protein) synthase